MGDKFYISADQAQVKTILMLIILFSGRRYKQPAHILAKIEDDFFIVKDELKGYSFKARLFYWNVRPMDK